MTLKTQFDEDFPNDIIKILGACSFDSELSLLSINTETISDIEEYVNENLSILSETSYKNVEYFKFKPGHKAFLLSLPEFIQEKKNMKPAENIKLSNFSHILKTFIETAESNFGRPPNGRRYNETNRYFSIFIYLMCGKACYETLCSNLPIPQANTLRESTLNHSHFMNIDGNTI